MDAGLYDAGNYPGDFTTIYKRGKNFVFKQFTNMKNSNVSLFHLRKQKFWVKVRKGSTCTIVAKLGQIKINHSVMKKLSIVLLLLSTLLSSCEKVFFGEIDPYNKQLFLYAEYSNTAGNNPAINLDLNASSKAIQINPANTAAFIANGRINLEMSNIRIADALGTYKINTIQTEEYRNGQWEGDKENFLRSQSAKELDVVLVLDVSSSLGSDVNDVKRYAIDFVNSLFAENPNSRIGVVGFSENIEILPFTTDRSLANSFIDGLSGGNATKLYEAMDMGINIIESSSADGRAIVTFTDGKNNSWSDPQKYSNSNLVYNRLLASQVNSYTIGLKGKNEGVDETELRRLAVRGLYSFPTSTTELNDVFKKFANSVSAAYLFIYDRNVSQILTPIKLRFLLNTTVF